MNNLRQLHIIRGLAALYVAVGHAKVVFWSGGKVYLEKYPISGWHVLDYLLFAVDMLSGAAQEFVIVFFVLSGFFIAHSFDKNKWTIGGFLVNRIIRIYPPYLFSIVMAVCVFFFIDFYNPDLFSGDSVKPIVIRITNSFNELNFEGFVKAIVFLPQKDYIAGNLAYWSLLPEWLFYLVIPFLITRKERVLVVLGVLYLINLLLRLNFENDLLKFIFEFGFYFFFGAFLFTSLKNKEWLNKMPSKLISYSLVFGLVLATIGSGLAEIKPYSNLVACLLAFFSVVTLIRYPLRGILVKVGGFLGDISYTLYVCHLPVYYFVYAILTKQLQQEVFYSRIYWLMIPIAVFVSYLSYLLVEKKSLKYIALFKLKR